jgi:hypothetical protein
MTDFDESVFWPELQAAGMLRQVRVKPSGRAATDVYVRWDRPDDVSRIGAQATDYEMEYQHADLPTLAEGNQVTLLDDNGDPVAGGKYQVRQAPFVPPDPANSRSGFFRHAYLTKL